MLDNCIWRKARTDKSSPTKFHLHGFRKGKYGYSLALSFCKQSITIMISSFSDKNILFGGIENLRGTFVQTQKRTLAWLMTRFGKKWISIVVGLQLGKQFLCGNGMMLCKKQLGNRTLFATMDTMETVSLGGHRVADTCCPIKPFLSIKSNHKWANQFSIFFE